MKRQIFIAILMICFTIILMLGLTGCTKNESKTDKMVAYMNTKYDDHFEYSAPYGGGAGGSASQIIVSSEKYPDAEIFVTYTPETETFADNYVNYKFEKQTYEFLEELLDSVLQTDFLLTYSVGNFGTTSEFTDKTVFEDYISNIKSYIGFVAVVSEKYTISDMDEFTNKLEEKFSENRLLAQGRLYFAQNSSQFMAFDQLDTEILQAMPQLKFNMASPEKFDVVEWR